MKYCPNCGSGVDVSDGYCHECGEELNERETESSEAEKSGEVSEGETEAEEKGEEVRDKDTGELTDIKAVGETKAEALRDAGYETVDDLREETQEEIAEVENIGSALSARIKSNAERAELEEEDSSETGVNPRSMLVLIALVVVLGITLSALGSNFETGPSPDSPDSPDAQGAGTTDGSTGGNDESAGDGSTGGSEEPAGTDSPNTGTADGTDTKGNGDTESRNTNTGTGQVSVDSNDYSPEFATNTMSVEYSTNTVSAISPPDVYTQEPDPGNKFVVVRADVTIESERDGQVEVYGSVITLEAEGIIYDGSSIQGRSGFTKTVVPGTTYEAWKYFEVPEEVNQATLTTSDPNLWFSRRTGIRFEQNEDISARIPE